MKKQLLLKDKNMERIRRMEICKVRNVLIWVIVAIILFMECIGGVFLVFGYYKISKQKNADTDISTTVKKDSRRNANDKEDTSSEKESTEEQISEKESAKEWILGKESTEQQESEKESTGTTSSEDSESYKTLVEQLERSEADELLYKFLLGEELLYGYYGNTGITFKELMQKEEFMEYPVEGRMDLDNDGEDELILNGMYGGIYVDAADGKVTVFESGDGTAEMLGYVEYDGAVWIVHSDTTHNGRQIYLFTKYEGADNIVDTFDLKAEYYDSPSGMYDENSDFTYRNKKISMEEYERIHKEIFGY